MEAAIVLTEGVVLCPDPVLIPICPPCCYQVRTQVLQCLCHALDYPHPSPNHLSLILPHLHMQGSIVKGHKQLLVTSIDSRENSSKVIQPFFFLPGSESGKHGKLGFGLVLCFCLAC